LRAKDKRQRAKVKNWRCLFRAVLIASLVCASAAFSADKPQFPQGMYCGGNQLIDMGGLRASSVAGVVEDPSGDVIPHARVQLQVQGSAKLVRNIESDERGRFTLSHLRPGDYWLGISASGLNLHFWHLQVVHGAHRISLTAKLTVGT